MAAPYTGPGLRPYLRTLAGIFSLFEVREGVRPVDYAGAQDSTLLNQYFQDLILTKPVSRNEEVELARQSRAGSREARERLILANLRFVVSIAKEYQNRGMPLVDLISAGNLGLITAADRFDETRGFKFISYAVWWIRQAIQQSLSQDRRMIRLPANRVALLGKIVRAYQELQQSLGGTPGPGAVAEKLGIPVEMVQDILTQAQDVGSLDASFCGQEDQTLLDVLSDQNENVQEAEVIEQSARKLVERALDVLEEREAEIIRLYFGLGNGEPLTLEEIGTRFNLTRERIRQIKEKALRRLKHPRHRALLEPLLESV